MPVHRTVCPRNCYGTCGMLVTVQNGRVTRIDGDPKNPATGGHVCVKGLSYARRVSAPNRLLHPLRRTPAGTFERVGWNEALQDIASRLERARQAHGPASVLYYDGSGSHGVLGRLALAFWHQFGGCTVGFGDLCWPAGLEATRLTYGANLHNHPRLTRESRFILVWGHNPAETNVHQWRLILDAQDRGAKLAVIDPRGTDSTDAADLHLQPRPGTDGALALGLARAIVDAGLQDAPFLARHAEGVDRYLERLREYPVEHVSEITGVDAGTIRHVATSYAVTRPALLIAGFGLQRHHQGGQAMRAVALLPALTGNVGIAGGGWQYANLASHAVADPPLPPEPAGLRRAFPVSRLGPALRDLDCPRLTAAWVEKANPASQNPQSGLVRRALEQLDLLVVSDQVLTDTARLAHYVLPAKSLFEEEDLCTAYWHPYIQRRAKILAPPGEVRTETEVWRALSERFGFDTRYFPTDAAAIPRLLEGLLPAGMSLDALADAPGLPPGVSDVAFESRRFPTPSGRVEFASEEARRLWSVDDVPGYTPLAEGHASSRAERFPLQLVSCKTRDRIHSQFGTVDWVQQIERPHRLDLHPADAAARGLCEGDRAAAWNERGRVEAIVRLDEGLRRGVVHILEGRCHEGDPDVNLLTDAGVTDMNHGATFYECLVEVEAAERRTTDERRTKNGERRTTNEERRTPDECRTEDDESRTKNEERRTEGERRTGNEERRTENASVVAPQFCFVLDLGRCVGCSACVVACRLENGWHDDAPWRRVLPLNLRRRPGGPTYFLSVACHHCERPACVAACPSGAYEKRADGIVVHSEERCIGCRYCEMACPFGAPRYDAARRVMTKCELCRHRLDANEQPACVAACPVDALRLAAPDSPIDGARTIVPGFTDPAGCRPATRFVSPRRARRAELLRRLEQRLGERGKGGGR